MMRQMCKVMWAFILVLGIAVAGGGVSAKAAQFELPALLTSVGQSTDIAMLRVALRTVPIEIAVEETITADQLGNTRTLLVAVGASSKGLGVAGVGVDQETQRAKALIDAAKAQGIRIVVIHVGGEPRRGALSDRFIDATVPSADYVIVVASGNKDGYFNRLAPEGTPVVEIERIPSVGPTLESILGGK